MRALFLQPKQKNNKHEQRINVNRFEELFSQD